MPKLNWVDDTSRLHFAIQFGSRTNNKNFSKIFFETNLLFYHMNKKHNVDHLLKILTTLLKIGKIIFNYNIDT